MRFYIYYGGEWGIPRIACACIRRHRFEPPIKGTSCIIMAESGGFEPPIQILTV